MDDSEAEANFDGLVGPTHHYGGLSPGNLASLEHGGTTSNPRAAALEGLAKMRYLAQLGVPQAVLPPHERPHLPTLRRLGFQGADAQVLAGAAQQAPALLGLTSSASAMWVANAATACPSRDAADGRLHLTVANLSFMFHRSLEAPTNYRIFSRMFADRDCFAVHEPLPAGQHFSDEGAANHTRLATRTASVHLFGWGRAGFPAPPGAGQAHREPALHPARQTREGSLAVSRLNQVSEALLWQQHPRGIDAGSFHSDVLAVGHRQLFLLHELAFVEPQALIETLSARLDAKLEAVLVSEHELPVRDAVSSYAFNSQIVTAGDGSCHLVAPTESFDNAHSRRFLESLVERGLISRVHYLGLNASMNNGGGPACLRLRIPLSGAEQRRVRGRIWLDQALGDELEHWIEKYYRDRLAPRDLADPALLREGREALDELTRLLEIGNVYDFQDGP